MIERKNFGREHLGRLADGVRIVARRLGALNFINFSVDNIQNSLRDNDMLTGIERGIALVANPEDALVTLPSGHQVDFGGMIGFISDGGVVEDRTDELLHLTNSSNLPQEVK